MRLVAHSNDKAPLEENTHEVLLEVIDTSSTRERSGLDLVAVLDVSGSMEGPKLDKLKVAMKFVISKLGAMDRLLFQQSRKVVRTAVHDRGLQG